MKNRKTLVFVLVLGIMLLGCNGNGSADISAQSSNNDQRIVGTWVCTFDSGKTDTFVFNANGSCTNTYDGKTVNSTYGISLTGEIRIVDSDGISFNGGDAFIIYFSPDGKTFIWDTYIYRKR